MSIATKQIANQDGESNYIFGTNDEKITQLSVERSYSINIDIVDGKGELKDILYGGEEVKISATKVLGAQDQAPILGADFSAGGAKGAIIKFAKLKSNEDVSKVQIEALGFSSSSNQQQ